MVDEERTHSFIFMPRICTVCSRPRGANNVICCGSASCMASAGSAGWGLRNAGPVTMSIVVSTYPTLASDQAADTTCYDLLQRVFLMSLQYSICK